MSKSSVVSQLKEEQPRMMLTEEEAYNFCQETVQLAKGLRVGYMMLAQRLHRIKAQKLYQPVHEKWYMYCDEIGIKEDLASKLTTIYEKFCREFGIDFEEIKEIEYSKLYMIKPVCETKELAEHWIDEAKELTSRDLRKKIQEVTLNADQTKCPHADTYLVRCCRECGETWEEYGKETVTVTKAFVMDIIAEEKAKAGDNSDYVDALEMLEDEMAKRLQYHV